MCVCGLRVASDLVLRRGGEREKGYRPIGKRVAGDQSKRTATNQKPVFLGWPPETCFKWRRPILFALHAEVETDVHFLTA